MPRSRDIVTVLVIVGVVSAAISAGSYAYVYLDRELVVPATASTVAVLCLLLAALIGLNHGGSW